MLLSVSKRWIGLCVLFGTLCLTSAIFEEQLGEFDWKRENIGLVEASFVIRDELVVSTADGVLACLDTDSGSAKWRVVLPQAAKIVKFVEVDGQLVTLVSSPVTTPLNENVSSMTVRSWSVSDGSLLWDTFLGNSAAEPVGALDVMYDSASKQITVLFDNALHFITAPASQAATPTYWSWSASTDVASTPATHGSTSDAFSTSQPELTLALSSLIAPTYSPEQSQSGRSVKAATRRAVGCYVRAADKGVCDGEVVVVKVDQGSVALDVFGAFPEDVRVLAADLTAAVASDAVLSYQANDVAFASSGGGKSLAVLGLGANQLVADFPLQGGAQDAVKTFVYVGADGELRPAASVCTRSACQSIVAVAPASGSSSPWAAERLEDGKADCEGGDVRLQFGSYQFFDRVVHSVSCAAVSALDARLASVSLKAGGSVQAKSTTDLTPFGVTIPPFHHPASVAQAQHFLNQNERSAVHHLALLPAKGKKASAGEQCAGHKLLAVLHSGHTLLLSLACNPASSPASAVGGLLLWSRLEGLARAQQAVVLDRVAGSAAQDSGDSRMPSFAERLALQRGKVLNYVASGSDTIAAIVDAAKDAVHGLSARIGGKSAAAELGGRKPLKRRDVEKLKTFGFDKVAAVLCYSSQLSSLIEQGSGNGVPFAQAGLQLMFVDLLRSPAQGRPAQDEEIRSVRYLSLGDHLAVGAEEEEIVFVKLLPNSAPTRRLSSAAEGASSPAQSSADPVGKSVTLIVGTASGRTYFWDVDPAAASATAAKVCAADESCSLSQGSAAAQKVSLERYTVCASGDERAGAPIAVAATAAFSSPAYTVLHSSLSEDGGDLAFVTVLHDQHMTVTSADQPVYVHAVDKTSGKIAVFKTSTNAADIAACASLQYSAGGSDSAALHRLRLSCVPVRAAASARFDPRDEKIVAVTYPSAQDAVHVPYSILGDDSVLLKYLNPHVALVTTISTATATTTSVDPEASTVESVAAPSEEGPIAAGDASEHGSVLYWTLVDTVTGKVILRLHQESAALPVHAILMENHIVATYWNTKAKRTELSSTALYEGVIDNTELTPFASSRARSNSAYLAAAAASASSRVRSAYSSIPPIAMQKTYTLPRAVSALHHTVTAHGLSNKNLLLGLRNGQIYSVDLKQVHPRRPFSDPSTAEKTEGLVRYSPFVTLMPLSALTHNYSLPRGVSRIVSTASNLESSSLVLSFGGAAVDIHLNRVMPSQDFDLLSSDFNYSLLVAILLALATAVLFLRNLQQRKHLGTIWA